ncbi:GntR family transcriptional regulator [Shimazuella alba]|uniref:GntR family transcriptional regulator n=1 Tax=Shimazuella alba TaxID=2690964 RepID=A0A6I4VZ66_9BACL|nr:GntR family transcriptional regulator [Shimazuella alba]MXQ53382.1 GntR family transcriptional regulator [Shimazuella alba]
MEQEIYSQLAEKFEIEISEGRWYPGMILPYETKLVDRFGVSRSTIDRVLATLVEKGIVTRKDSLYIVVRQKPTPESSLREEFQKAEVHLDLLTLTAQNTSIFHILGEILDGTLPCPDMIKVRMLMPNLSPDGKLQELPRSVDNPDDKRPQQRLYGIQSRAVMRLRGQLERLSGKYPVKVELKIKTIPFPPLFKLCIVNNQVATFGLYQIRESEAPYDGDEIRLLDMTNQSWQILSFAAGSGDERDPLFVNMANAFFNSMWLLFAEDATSLNE